MSPSIEDFLALHASFPPEVIKDAPVADFLALQGVEPLSSGLQTYVFRLTHDAWVVKEGRWDLKVPISSNATIPLHAGWMQALLKRFSFTFLPTEEEILKRHDHYIQSLPYLGYFEKDPPRYPDIASVVSQQKALRDSLIDRLPAIQKEYKLALPPRMAEILSSPVRHHNFLLKEYLLIGKAYSPANDVPNRQTFFVFQQYVEGATLHDSPVPQLQGEQRDQFALLLFLLLVLHLDTGLVPDTRPRYILSQAHQWLTKTDNIILSKEGLKFVDTSWFWQADGNFIERGLFIPNWTINRAKKELKSLLR